jgi:hypothetical protein
MINRSRRSFVCSSATLLVLGKTVFAASSEDVPYSDQVAADEWMKKWMQSPRAAVGELFLGRFADRIYFLRKEIEWTPNPGQGQYNAVKVPVGFVTDFASIPRVFWSVLPPDDLYTYAAIIHDFLYWEQPVPRKEADLILKFAMQDFKVNAGTIETIYAGVRAGGEVAWESNANLKASGERRILKKYPTDPTVRWNDWKTIPDNFW